MGQIIFDLAFMYDFSQYVYQQQQTDATPCIGNTYNNTHVSNLIFFSATSFPEFLSRALYTTPYVPSPIFSIF